MMSDDGSLMTMYMNYEVRSYGERHFKLRKRDEANGEMGLGQKAKSTSDREL